MTENMEISIFQKLHFCNFFSSKKSLQRFFYISQELSILGENVSLDGQNYCSKGSKWGIVCLSSSSSDWDMTEVMDILIFGKMHFLTLFFKNVKVIDQLKIKILKAGLKRTTQFCQMIIKNVFLTHLSQFQPTIANKTKEKKALVHFFLEHPLVGQAGQLSYCFLGDLSRSIYL